MGVERRILSAQNDYADIDEYLQSKGVRRIFLVHGKAAKKLKLGIYFANLPSRLHIDVCSFTKFHPNPSYDSVVDGVESFREHGCDMVVALGGGSAIDVAKCIKLYAYMNSSRNYLQQEIVPNEIPLLAIPTTAGTGSEVTRYAVIYYEGEKQSIVHENCIPEAVCLDPSVLESLPAYHRASSMLDALCHAVESLWSVNSTEESRKLSKKAMRLILSHRKAYMQGDFFAAEYMMQAAYLAGKAINITQTTAGHAMCYKLTSLYGLAHGHAAALCNSVLLPYTMLHLEDCCDARGKDWLKKIILELTDALDCKNLKESTTFFSRLIGGLGIERAVFGEENLDALVSSVNPVRLRNHPVRMDERAFRELYARILMG